MIETDLGGQPAATNDPMPPRRTVAGKYDAVFSQVQPGQRIVCPPGTGSRLAVQLRKWLAMRNYQDVRVRGIDRCDDGHGDVWLISARKPVATRWNTPGGAAPLATDAPAAAPAKGGKKAAATC